MTTFTKARSIFPKAAIALMLGLSLACPAPAFSADLKATRSRTKTVEKKVAKLVARPAAPLPEQKFADAPDGVDPIVTGPISKTFKSRLRAAKCGSVDWPHAPDACYPK